MLSSAVNFVRHVFADFSAHDCPTMAAALAYGTIFSLPSLLLIVIFIAGLILGPHAASGQIQAQFAHTLGPEAAGQIQTMVHNIASNRRGGLIATALGAIGLLLSATSVIMQLQQSLNRAWGVKVTGSGAVHFARRRIRSGLVVIGAGVLALISLVIGAAFGALSKALPSAEAAWISNALSSILVFALIFAAILKIMPDVKLRWTDVILGGLMISLLFALGKFLIALYLGRAAKTSAYGAAGSLAMILLWTYYSALIFLLGVEFTQVWVRSRGKVIEAKPGAQMLEAPAQP